MAVKTVVETRQFFPADKDVAAAELRALSSIAHGLVGSEILKISAEIRSKMEAGKAVCNLTVGDFAPSQFRIPAELEAAIADALAAGETNYPPSDGLLDLRNEVVRFYEEELGLSYPVESVLIAGGSRPVIFGTYAAIVSPGEKVLYPTPSWNNNHYTFLSSAVPMEIVVGPETNFLPTAKLIEPFIHDVRLICINTPLNPTGTVMAEEEVRDISQLIVRENERRKKVGARSLYLMWDQVYWMLTFGDARHHTPPELVPEMAEWTIIVDGISKAFAATGLRVGWAVAPPFIARRMRDILGHVGAWAPRPEQVATANILRDKSAIERFHLRMISEVRERLDLLHDGFQMMRRASLPIDSVPPQGAIYLSARFDLVGRRYDGKEISTNEEIRRLLLEEAGFGVVPFQAFGLKEESGWMRLSVGAVSPDEIRSGLDRVRAVLERVD